MRARRRRYYQQNRLDICRKQSEYQLANKEKLNAYRSEYWSRRRQSDPTVKLRYQQYDMVRRMASRSTLANNRTREVLGYTPERMAQRIECQFTNGMSWDNYGEWHIDHKIPISRFIERGETRPHIVNALSNLQPMWASDNLSKGNRWIG